MTGSETNGPSTRFVISVIAAATAAFTALFVDLLSAEWALVDVLWLSPFALILIGLSAWLSFRERSNRALERMQEVAEEFPIQLPADLLTSDSPSVLMRPELAVWPYQKQDELAQVKAWLHMPLSRTFFVVTGPALVGKSRLTVQLAQNLPRHWSMLRLRASVGRSAFRAIREAPGSHLVVVELDEVRDGIEDFLDAASDNSSGEVKVLLVGRSMQWISRRIMNCQQSTRDSITEAERITPCVMRPSGSEQDLVRWEKQAGSAFATELSKPAPQKQLSPPAIGSPMGTIQAAVLASLLQGTGPATDLHVVLANHEMKLWQPPVGEQSSAGLLRRCFTAAWLFDAHDPVELREAVERIPELADARKERIHHLTDWLRRSYPGSTEHSVAYPLDTVSQAIAVPALTTDRELFDALTEDLNSLSQSRVVAKLLGAAEAFPDVVDLAIDSLLESGHSLDAIQLLEILRISPATGHTDHLLATMLRQCPPALAAARENLRQLERNVGLENSHAAILEIVLNLERSEVEPEAVSNRSHALARVLQDLGQHEKALEHYREALRLLTPGNPTVLSPHDPARASILIDLASCKQEQGDNKGAAKEFRMGLALLRRLHKATRPVDSPLHLAIALGRYGTSCSMQGREEEALIHHKEALALFRGLPESAVSMNNFTLAVLLSGLATALRGSWLHQDAIAPSREALLLLQRTIEPGDKRATRELARAQVGLAESLYALGDCQRTRETARRRTRSCPVADMRIAR